MSNETNPDRTESREVLREMLSQIREETRQTIEVLRRATPTADIEDHASAEEKLKHLDEAMVRFDAGEYGSCLKCATAIPLKRLVAIPFASYCFDCQKKLDRVDGGWGHAPYNRQWTASKGRGPSPQVESCFARGEHGINNQSEPTGSVQSQRLKWCQPQSV
jgi:RNA polymerase-binding transcription factor DksA